MKWLKWERCGRTYTLAIASEKTWRGDIIECVDDDQYDCVIPIVRRCRSDKSVPIGVVAEDVVEVGKRFKVRQ